jgi:hypothetical protein
MPGAELQVGRFDTLVRRLLSIKGQQLFPNLSGELSTELTLESDRPEWAALKGEKLCGASGTWAALAANINQFQLVNPANSGHLVVVIDAQFSNDGPLADMMAVALLGGGLLGTTFTTAVVRDQRFNRTTTSPMVPVGQSRGAQAAGITGGAVVYWTAAIGIGGTLRYSHPVILAPGQSLLVTNFVVAQGSRIGWSWYERPAESSELILPA